MRAKSKIIILANTLFALFFVMALTPTELVDARPTEAPPGGNPPLNIPGPTGIQGPAGPTGNTGSQGLQGPPGPKGPYGFSDCRVKFNQCSFPYFGGCNTSVSPTAGYYIAGTDCMTNAQNVWVVDLSISSGAKYCSCHDYGVATSAYCYAVIWECKP